MNKRIISLIAAAFMLLSVVQTAVFPGDVTAAEDTYEPYAESEAFLKGLGIIDGKDDINMNVTRGKAAVLVCSMLDENKNMQSYRGIFSDVPEDSEEALSIEKLADLGIIRGSEGYMYNPSDMLTYKDAGYIFANVLGYGLISNSGLTPLQVVQNFGINDNIKAEFDYVTLGDFYVMMKNALFSGSYVQSSYGSEAEYVKTDRTLLNSIYDILYADGRIVRNDVTSLWSAENYRDSDVWLETGANKNILKINVPNPSAIREDLGKSVRIYYKKNEETGAYDYVYHEIKKANNILSIKLEMIDNERTNLEKGTVSYYSESDRRYNASLPSDVAIIYNGAAYKGSSFDFGAVSGKVGDVELIDSDGDSRYETVKITVYESIVAGVVSVSNNFISDKYNTDRVTDTDPDNYTKIFVYDENGDETEISSIVQGSAISVAKSDTYSKNDVLTIRVSRNVINGKIIKTKEKNSVQYITVDGDEPRGAYDRAAKGSYLQNSSIVAYIDVFGNIIYVTTDYQRDMQYGVLAGVGKSSGTIDPKVNLRIVSSAGKIGEYELDKKAVIDGASYSGKETEAYNRLKNISFKTTDITFPSGVSPIRYKLDSNGKTVKKIDTIGYDKKTQDDVLELMGSGTYYGNSGQVLGWSVPYAADAVVLEFLAPDYSTNEAFKDEMDIAVNNASMFRQGTSYHVAALKSDTESSTADFILKFNFTTIEIGYDNDLFVVDEISEGKNEIKDSVMYLVSGY